MGYLSGGIDCVRLVPMRSRSNTYEWKWEEFWNEGGTLVIAKCYGSGQDMVNAMFRRTLMIG